VPAPAGPLRAALNSSVAPLPGGAFVVVWRGDAPKYPIFGQRYNNSAVKVGSLFTVTPTSPEKVVPFVAAIHGGGFRGDMGSP
jgi:hypothetical protein